MHNIIIVWNDTKVVKTSKLEINSKDCHNYNDLSIFQ